MGLDVPEAGGSKDCLTVATVDTERAQRLSAYKPSVIKNRYETDLVTFLPESRWRVMVIPKAQARRQCNGRDPTSDTEESSLDLE